MTLQITWETFLNSKKISLKVKEDSIYQIQVKEDSIYQIQGDRRGRDLMVVGFTLPVSIAIKVVSSNRAHSGVYSIQHCVMQFVSDLQ